MNATYYNRHNTPYKIVEFIDGSHVIVQFQDEHGAKTKTVIEAAKNGFVKNPYDKSVFGLGYVGNGKYLTTCGKHKMTDRYNSWKDMIGRCYIEKYSLKYPAYYGVCNICDEWFDFQNFSEWYENNRYECSEKLHLDKDILIKDNKTYSPDNCLLVPQRINMIFMKMKKIVDADLPTGISRSHLKSGEIRYRATYNGKMIGTFSTLKEACENYMSAKRIHIKEVAEEYRDIVPIKVYDALTNW